MTRSTLAATALAAAVAGAEPLSSAARDVPADVEVELRLFEARSLAPDYAAMDALSFLLDTDGDDVSDRQWVATVGRQTPLSLVASLAYDIPPLENGAAAMSVVNGSREVRVRVELGGYGAREPFGATARIELWEDGERARAFTKSLELSAGRTLVASDRRLELTTSEYVSYFRSYEDAEERSALYEQFREFTTFLVLAVSVRATTDEAAAPPLELAPPGELPEVESPFGISISGRVELELELDDQGAPAEAHVRRSTLPEANAYVLEAAESWRFPEARNRRTRIELELTAVPDR